MAEIAVVKFSLKLVWGLIANRAIAKLEHGDVTDEKLRQLLLSEFRKLHEQLNALRRKELVAATAFMENGYELLNGDVDEALKEFNKARDAAQMAFGVVPEDLDKVLATKIMVASAIHEFAAKPSTAESLCLKYLARLNGLPEVASACAVTLGYKFGSKLRMMAGSSSRQELLRGVAEVNRSVWQLVRKYDENDKWMMTPWASVQCGEHRVNPSTNLILFRHSCEIASMPDNFNTAVCMVETNEKLFLANSASFENEEDKLLKFSIKVLDLETKKVSELVGHTAMVLSLTVTDNFVLSGSFDKNILVWDNKSLKCKHILSGHEGSIRVVAANAKYIFSGSADATIRVWGKESFELCQILKGHTMAVSALAVNNRFIFSVAVNEGIKIWDLRGWSCLQEIAMPMAQGSSTSVVHFVCNLALVHLGCSISIINLGNLKQVGILTDVGNISTIVGSMLYTSNETTLKCFNVEKLKSTCTKCFKDEQKVVCIDCMCYSNKTGYLYLACTITDRTGKRNVILRL